MDGSNQNSILVVNDDDDTLEMTATLLRRVGYSVLTAANGREGFQLAQSARPSLVVSDVSMPHVDGVELCRMIRADEELRTTPVMLVSALRKDALSVVEGLDAGADDYLEAPYDPMLLIAKVARLLERRRAEEDLENRVGERTAQLQTTKRELEAEVGKRRQVEDELRKEQVFTYAVLDNLRDGVIACDITMRKQLEERLQQLQRLETVGQLAGGVAHNFNNMLTAITGNSELLLQKLDVADPHRRFVVEIQKASERAAGLTRQLLAFGRKQLLQPKVIAPNAVISDMTQMLRQMLDSSVDLVISLDPSLGRVKADPGQLHQLILSLIVNARDAMPEGGNLTIETQNAEMDKAFARRYSSIHDGPHVLISVSDTGAGMDAETQSHVFEPFFTTKEQGKGVGLGLSTVYGIVKQSGGSIWVNSEIGQGTTFNIYFPLIDDPVQEKAEKNSATGEAPNAGTVLLVEDEELVRNFTRAVLEMGGYYVLEATNGREALQILDHHRGRIGLMLSDVEMPQMGGLELATRVSASRPETKVLLMSGYTNDTIVQRSGYKGDAAFLQKPFTPDALADKVRALLETASK